MADELIFYTNPMSRGQIGRWALHEAGADYEQVLVDWQNKPAALLAANPLGKVPTVIHHAPGGDRIAEYGAGELQSSSGTLQLLSLFQLATRLEHIDRRDVRHRQVPD